MALGAAGAFAIVLECVAEEAAKVISESIPVPTIGIGSGRYCDGQVLVFHDVVQYSVNGLRPSFVKTYADVRQTIETGLGEYVQDVKAGRFPEEQHIFHTQEAIYGGSPK